MNGTILITLKQFSVFHTSSYKILGALSLSQLLLGVLISPLPPISILTHATRNYHVLVMLRHTLTPILLLLTTNNLIFHCFERYIQVVTGSSYYQMQQQRVNVVLFLCYLIPALTYALRLLKDKDKTYLSFVQFEAWFVVAILIFIFGAVATALHNYTKEPANSLQADYA